MAAMDDVLRENRFNLQVCKEEGVGTSTSRCAGRAAPTSGD